MSKGSMQRDIEQLSQSGLVDEAWYLSSFPDVTALGLSAAEHYLRIGARLGRNPGPDFDTAYYLADNPDVATAGINPLLHYLRYGRKEGRRVKPDRAAMAALPRILPDDGVTEAIVVRSFVGKRQQDPHARTVLVCAHIAGGQLFGSERSLLDVLDGLAAMGVNVVVTIPGGGGDYVRALRDRSMTVVSFRYGWWTSGVDSDERAVAEFARLIATHRADAVHVNTIMLREPLLASRRMGVRVVLHAREIITHDAALIERIGEAPARIVEQVVASTDWLIANSEATAACFSKPGRTLVVPNTVDDALYAIAAPTAVGRPVTIGMVSSNIPKKGIEDFVLVAQLLHAQRADVRMLMIGPENRFVVELRERQAAGEVPESVLFPGYSASPAEALAHCDIVVNFSHFRESFGRTVLEAMAAARPVVAYAWGAIPELVADQETGFVVPYRDVEAAAERLLQLSTDQTLRLRMGAAARSRARRLFSTARYREQLRDAYDRIFAADVAPTPTTLPARNLPTPRPEGPLRLAYFLWHFPVPSETFVLNELRILVEQGHDVEVYCRQSPHNDFVPDFPITWTRVADPAELAAALVRNGREMVHSHFVYPTVTEMVWPACEQAGVPFTFIAHAQDIFRHVNVERNRIGEIARSPHCLRVLVPSHFHREYVQHHGVPAAKILINPNGIDPDLYDQGQGTRHAARARRRVCAIHRFTGKKGLSSLIGAAPALAAAGIEVHLHGYGELEEEYRKQIHALGIDNVHLHGPVRTRQQMLKVFADSDLFACPSVRAADGDMDGIPTVLMEAMASGLPVLATGISGIPDLVQDGATGIVCAADAEDVAEAILRFYAMPDAEVASMIEDARALVAGSFNAKRLTRRLVRLWQRRTVDLMIVSWNNLPELHEVVRRLCAYTSMPWHLVVCDNGSKPDVAAFLCELHAYHGNVTVVLNRKNAFVGPGTNICLANSHSDYAVYVCGKEGFVLESGWEKPLIEYMDEHPAVGQAGTLCYSPSYLTGDRYPVAIPEFPKFRNREFAEANPQRRFAHVQGGFFVLRRSMVDEIGGFSDAVPHNYTDVEFSYYVESRGWQLGSVPGLLSLYNKTRPGIFSRLDEHVGAIHPPRLGDLRQVDAIAAGTIRQCNVCEWSGPAFEGDDALCPECGSAPADRTLYRFLAESMLTYRRLPALGLGVGEAMQGIWRKQFQGQLHDFVDGEALRAQEGRFSFRDGSLKLIYLQTPPGADVSKELWRECDRILAADGMLLLRDPEFAVTGAAGVLARIHPMFRSHAAESVRYRSRVVGHDSVALQVLRRCEVDQCVS